MFGGSLLVRNSLDPDAQAYITAVELADGQPLEGSVKKAINSFVVGCKSDGIWDAIKASCIMAGARTLNGALTPLKGVAPTNFNFVAGDYSRKTGLKGNGTSKYLNSNRSNAADPQNSKHSCVYIVEKNTQSNPYMASQDNASGSTILIARFLTGNHAHKNNCSAIGDSGNSSLGFLGTSRDNAANYVVRTGGESSSIVISSQVPGADDLLLFREIGANRYGQGRLSFYSIGESLDLAKLDARITALINDFNSYIP